MIFRKSFENPEGIIMKKKSNSIFSHLLERAFETAVIF